MLTEGYLFDETNIEKIADGVYEAETTKIWFGAVGLFGGYVLAIVLRALTQEVNDPLRFPRSLSTHFLRPYPDGPMRIETTLERAGSSVSVLSYRVFVEDKLCGVGIGTFGKNRAAEERTQIKAPSTRPFDPTVKQITSIHELPCLDNFEIWLEDEKSAEGKSESIAWIRLSQDKAAGSALDNLFFIAAADAVPPVAVQQDSFGKHFMGTMDFTAHFRRPDIVLKDEPVLVRISTVASGQGYVDEDCELYTPDGTLLLQSRQLRFMQKVD